MLPVYFQSVFEFPECFQGFLCFSSVSSECFQRFLCFFPECFCVSRVLPVVLVFFQCISSVFVCFPVFLVCCHCFQCFVSSVFPVCFLCGLNVHSSLLPVCFQVVCSELSVFAACFQCLQQVVSVFSVFSVFAVCLQCFPGHRRFIIGIGSVLTIGCVIGRNTDGAKLQETCGVSLTLSFLPPSTSVCFCLSCFWLV